MDLERKDHSLANNACYSKNVVTASPFKRTSTVAFGEKEPDFKDADYAQHSKKRMTVLDLLLTEILAKTKRSISLQSKADSESESEHDFDEDDYFQLGERDDTDMEFDHQQKEDPEYFDFHLLTVKDVELLINQKVEALCEAVNVKRSFAKILLRVHKWDVEDILKKYQLNADNLLEESKINPPEKHQSKSTSSHQGTITECSVCSMSAHSSESLQGLSCGHMLCSDCWQSYFNTQINSKVSTGMECPQMDCDILVPEDIVLKTVKDPKLRDEYMEYTFNDLVKSHPKLRYCPGPNCNMIIQAPEPKAKRVHCPLCKSTYCFKCALEYHAPADCDMIKKWLIKCADDSKTEKFTNPPTKFCPKCQYYIDKDEGCNHVKCDNCKHDFCWMCFGDWKEHRTEFYDCSRYKEDPNMVNEGDVAHPQEATKKFLFYVDRYENHANSLKLEESNLCKIKAHIERKMNNNEGSWIDWHQVLKGPDVLRKCRYTLQYTYPCAYFIKDQAKKNLFEYQQARLEAEVENLAWALERTELADKGDILKLMNATEQRRLALLRGSYEV